MSRWYWDWCPHCNGEGWRDEVTGGSAGTETFQMLTTQRRCDCCDGCGRVKVPAGYHLVRDVTATITISAGATIKEGSPHGG